MSRDKRRLGAVATLAVAGIALTACGPNAGSTTGGAAGQDAGPAVKGGTLHMLGAGDVDFMDPNISYYSVGYLGLRMWSRQLFSYPAVEGKTTTPAVDLAAEIPTKANHGISADGKTYTIKIKPGTKWNTSPARAVTAADVVRGVKRTCNPVQPFGGVPDFDTLLSGFQAFCAGFAKAGKTAPAIGAYIEKTPLPGVVAKDASTVVFKLNHPATYFVDMLTLSAFSPAPVEVNKYLPGSTELGNHQISDGPYKIDSWVPTKSITFSRNPSWDPATDTIRKAYVDKIVVDQTVSQESVQQQLQTGTPSADLEWDVLVPPSQLPALIAKKDPNLSLGASSSSNPYLVFNTVSPNNGSALANAKIRQALSYAVNRSNIIQVLGGPKIEPPLTHVLPDGLLGSKQSDPYPYNPEKAKQLLAEAGHPNLTLKMLYRNASEGSSKAFQTIQQDLSKVGVNVVGVPAPNADFYVKYLEVPTVAKRGVWDLSLAGWSSDWYGNAALTFFNPLFSGPRSFPPTGSNFGLYNSPATNKLIQQAEAATTDAQTAALWAQADAQVMKDAAFFPITNPRTANYHAEQVHNAVYVPQFSMFDPTNVWLSKDKQG